ncbi:MAG: type I restriction endonuclease subunit M [Vitreoscilla sp.]
MKFALGRIVATRGAIDEMERLGVNPAELVTRHVMLDQGALCSEDHKQNQHALVEGSLIFSSFEYHGVRLWVITEWDRSVTTILLPDEY